MVSIERSKSINYETWNPISRDSIILKSSQKFCVTSAFKSKLLLVVLLMQVMRQQKLEKKDEPRVIWLWKKAKCVVATKKPKIM